MKKIAIFVEGQTERIFVEKLIDEYLTFEDYDLESIKSKGNNSTEIIKRRKNVDIEYKYYFLIWDVGGGEKVLSNILERSNKLINISQYSKIIGLKDFYPDDIKNKEKVFSSTSKEILKTNLSEYIKLVFAIMEIEAWFLAEYTLFEKINSILSVQYIKDKLGRDLFNDNPEDIRHPSEVMNKIYQLINQKYNKREKQSYQICHNLDFLKLCFEDNILNKITSFKLFLKEIGDCL